MKESASSYLLVPHVPGQTPAISNPIPSYAFLRCSTHLVGGSMRKAFLLLCPTCAVVKREGMSLLTSVMCHRQ